MSQTKQVRGVATSIHHKDGATHVRYHDTDVVSFTRGETHPLITLRSGGWQTATTKARMNQASNQFDLGFQVYQKDFAWFVNSSEFPDPLPFEDGMQFTAPMS